MKYAYLLFFSLWVAVWLTLPVFASIDSVIPDSGKTWKAFKVQGPGPGSPNYRGSGRSYSSEDLSSELFHESRDKTDNTNNQDTRSYSDFLGPTFDNPSVKGEPSTYDSWWDNQSSADPMVKDLSRNDGGGFSSEGSGAGSVPGSHGK